MTDYRALCAELLTWAERTSAHYVVPPDVILRARAALAQPLPEGPTDEEIMELMPQQLWKDLATVSRLAAHGAGPDVGPGLFRVTLNAGIVEHCRAVLARWGRPAVEPVPVSERLPGPEDCAPWPDEPDAAPWAWAAKCVAGGWEWAQLSMLGMGSDSLARSVAGGGWTHWAPHWALPVPQEGADGQH